MIHNNSDNVKEYLTRFERLDMAVNHLAHLPISTCRMLRTAPAASRDDNIMVVRNKYGQVYIRGIQQCRKWWACPVCACAQSRSAYS